MVVFNQLDCSTHVLAFEAAEVLKRFLCNGAAWNDEIALDVQEDILKNLVMLEIVECKAV